jgi:hypothetical protein
VTGKGHISSTSQKCYRLTWLALLFYLSLLPSFHIPVYMSRQYEDWELRSPGTMPEFTQNSHIAHSPATLICHPVCWICFIKALSCRVVHASTASDGQANRFCNAYLLETSMILMTGRKLLSIEIKNFYCRETLLVLRFIALYSWSESSPTISRQPLFDLRLIAVQSC